MEEIVQYIVEVPNPHDPGSFIDIQWFDSKEDAIAL